MSSIFVQIASYRDPELPHTISNILNNAEHPENLFFGICRQFHPEDKFDNIDQWRGDSRFRIIDYDLTVKDSLGACWARYSLQQLYQGEDYTFQLDSHMRFVKHWDSKLLSMFKSLKRKYPKPLITGYVPSYVPSNDPEGRLDEVWEMHFDRFAPEGYIATAPTNVENYKKISRPIRARFYSAHFAFAEGRFVEEVPHDPEFYFHGEEPSIAIRAFTWGYDLFHPHRIICWHEYGRDGKTKNWDDNKQYKTIDVISHYRYRMLLGMDDVTQVDLGRFGLGLVRTLEDWKEYSGIDVQNRSVQEYTRDRNRPPNKIKRSSKQYEDSFKPFFRHCIDLYAPHYTEPDYIVWAVAFEKDGNEIIRLDAHKDEIYQILKDAEQNNGFAQLWREYYGPQADKVIIWPNSVGKGWHNRTEISIGV